MLSITLWFRPMHTSGALSTVVSVQSMDAEHLNGCAQEVWDGLRKGGFQMLCERPVLARPDADDVTF